MRYCGYVVDLIHFRLPMSNFILNPSGFFFISAYCRDIITTRKINTIFCIIWNLALIYRYLFIMLKNSCSDMVFTPSFFAFLYFEPGSLPATTKSVFFDTEDDG